MPHLFPTLTIALLALFGGAALGDSAPCDPSSLNCSPLVVCIEATGEILRGASFGKDAGPFMAESSAGVLCEGTWRRSLMGLGLAKFNCSDGRSGTSAFTWF